MKRNEWPFGEGFQNICNALADIAAEHADVQVLYPVHLNPNVRQPVNDILAARGLANVHLIDPVDYLPFVYLMDRAEEDPRLPRFCRRCRGRRTSCACRRP